MIVGRWYQITINGEKWKYRFVPSTHELLRGDIAVTEGKHKRITFGVEEFSFKVAVHELFHAYCYYLYLNSTDITHTDYEEIVAEMLEDRILTIVEQSKQIASKVKPITLPLTIV